MLRLQRPGQEKAAIAALARSRSSARTANRTAAAAQQGPSVITSARTGEG